MLLQNIFVYILSFFFIWIGTGLIVGSVDRFAKKLRLSSFAFSFFILGMLTSTPEFAVGMTAVAEGTPEVFVGNLIGGIFVIFFLIIPLLAILGNGIKLKNQLGGKTMLFSFAVMLAPAFLVMDRKITNPEAIFLMALYGVLFFFIEKKKGIFDAKHSNILNIKTYSYMDILKVLLGVGIVFVSSHFIVENTLYFANHFHVSAFYISLLVLSLGTNLPELSLAVRSVISGKRDIAFGDYIGSAAANTFLFGLFSFLHTGDVFTANNFFNTFLLMAVGLCIFFYLSRSKQDISRKEGFLLFIVYGVFILLEQVG